MELGISLSVVRSGIGNVVRPLFHPALTTLTNQFGGDQVSASIRNSTATVQVYDSVAGSILRTANIDEARRQGMRRAYNALRYSEDFTHARWLKTSNGAGSAPTLINANAGTHTLPDGRVITLQQWRFTAGGATSTDRSLLSQGIGGFLDIGSTRNFSVYIATLSGQATMRIMTSHWWAAATVTVSSTVQRYSVVGPYNGAANSGTGIAYIMAQGDLSGAGSIDLLIGAAMTEDVTGLANQNPSEYVPRDTATGPELVTNGDFSQGGTGWTINNLSSWAISNGAIHNDGSLVGHEFAPTSINVEAGRRYLVSYDVSNYVSGAFLVRVGGAWGTTNPTANGHYEEIITATANGTTDFWADSFGGFNGTIDNISIKQVSEGVAYYDTTNGNTVTNNVVTEAAGSPLFPSTTIDGMKWYQTKPDWAAGVAYAAGAEVNYAANVTNIIWPSNDLTHANWATSVGTGSVTVNGGYTTVNDTSTFEYYDRIQGQAVTASTDAYIAKALIKKSTWTGINIIEIKIVNNSSIANNGTERSIQLRKDGVYAIRLDGPGGAVDGQDYGVVDNGDEWLVWVRTKGNGGVPSYYFRVLPAATDEASGLGTITVSATGSVDIRHCGLVKENILSPTIETVTGPESHIFNHWYSTVAGGTDTATFGDTVTWVQQGVYSDLGLLVEPGATNLLTYSEQFDNAAWSKSDVTVSANASIAPDGTMAADTLTQGVAGNASVAQYVTVTSGVDLSLSAYIKRINNDWAEVEINDPSFTSRAHVWFNLATGVAGATLASGGAVIKSYAIKAAGNGFYRIELTANIGAYTSVAWNCIPAVAGNASFSRVNGGAIYAWGAQLEQSPVPTSYIPTTTAAVTRDTETGTISWPLAGNFNNDEGALIFDYMLSEDSTTSLTVGGWCAIVDVEGGGFDTVLTSHPSSHNVRTTDKTNIVQSGARTFARKTWVRVRVAWSKSQNKLEISEKRMSTYGSSFTTYTGAYDGAFTLGTAIQLFNKSVGELAQPVYMRNAAIYGKFLSAADVEAKFV